MNITKPIKVNDRNRDFLMRLVQNGPDEYPGAKILEKKKIPEFFAGDTIKVGVRISEGKRERIQYFEGVCIAKKNKNINSSFTVRKISFGEGVERTFALYSPIVGSIKVVRSGKARRAKLYYLRDRKGKSARIAEKIKKRIGVDVSEQVTEKEVVNLSILKDPYLRQKKLMHQIDSDLKEHLLILLPISLNYQLLYLLDLPLQKS